jgi:hypothetical protein
MLGYKNRALDRFLDLDEIVRIIGQRCSEIYTLGLSDSKGFTFRVLVIKSGAVMQHVNRISEIRF